MSLESRFKYVVVLGVARSGTSHMASLLGAHPKIGMCFEEFYSGPFPRMAGKEWLGNKFSVPNQISWKKKFNLWDRRDFKTLAAMRYLMYKARVGLSIPRCPFSISDFPEEVKFVIVKRDKEATVSSWLRRAPDRNFPRFAGRKSYVERLYDRGMLDLGLTERNRESVVVQYTEGLGYTVVDMMGVFDFLGLKYTDDIWRGQMFNPVYPFEKLRRVAV